MYNSSVSNAILFVSLLLAQVLICNHIILFGVAVPFVFIFFIIRMPVNMNVAALLSLSFFLGLGVDLCSDTAGMNALVCTLVTVMRKSIFFSYVQKDDKSVMTVPSIASMGFGSYLRYMSSIVIIYCLLLFCVEYFSFSNVREILIKAAASSVLTIPLLLAIDSLISVKREKRL